MPKLEYQYFTFGLSSALSQYYVKLEGDYGDTRQEMFELFGRNWAFQYSSLDKFGVEKHRLLELPLRRDNDGYLKLDTGQRYEKA